MIVCNMLISNGFSANKATILSGIPKSTYYNRLLIKENKPRIYIPEKDVERIIELCSMKITSTGEYGHSYGGRELIIIRRRF